MTIGELIKKLAKYDFDKEVLIQGDADYFEISYLRIEKVQSKNENDEYETKKYVVIR